MTAEAKTFAERLEVAKQALKEILAARSIMRIVCVDDQYGRDRQESRY
jgi:hypothetical protein